MYSERFSAALEHAHRLHQHQCRKGTDIPYISHLIHVAAIAIEQGASEDEAIAALLHDSLEDTEATAEQLTQAFGPRVTEIVVHCTDDVPGIDRDSAEGWRQRKEAYLSHLRQGVSSSVLLVSCADKLANARSILADHRRLGDAVFDRFKAEKAGTLWYYHALAVAFEELAQREEHRQRPLLVALVAEYTHAVAELEQQAN